MLWVALYFPRLALEALLRGRAPSEGADEPWAVAEDRHVLACNPAAAAVGVQPGGALAPAWAIAPRLRVLPRNAGAEAAALEAIAAWACQFTPRVSLEPPQAVLLEVEGSLRLFEGGGRLMARLRSGLAGLGFEALLATGGTARAALWLARGARDALEALPVCAIAPPAESLELLRSIGIGTLGELMQLPRAAAAARLGQGLLDDIDRALGRLPEPREFFSPPARFASRLELPAPVTQAESLLFAAHRLLLQLEGFLAARQAGVRGFALRLVHRSAPDTSVDIGFAAPRRDAEQGLRLLRERLGARAFPAPVEALCLEGGEPVALAAATPDLFGDARGEAEAWARLLERLQARLGEAQVHGLAVHPDHRPERAWRAVKEREAIAEQAGPRPLWLLEPPRRLGEGDFALLAGPERIESGWWDGADARRDYFIARTAAGALAWIYRAPEGWFLHGLFA
jgi:protein ImuB